jgi:hypothetical protein
VTGAPGVTGTPSAHSGHSCAGHARLGIVPAAYKGTPSLAGTIVLASPSAMTAATATGTAPWPRSSSRQAATAVPALTASSVTPTRQPPIPPCT